MRSSVPMRRVQNAAGGDGCFQALHSDVAVIQTNVPVTQCGLPCNKAPVTLQPGRLGGRGLPGLDEQV